MVPPRISLRRATETDCSIARRCASVEETYMLPNSLPASDIVYPLHTHYFIPIDAVASRLKLPSKRLFPSSIAIHCLPYHAREIAWNL